jgi:monofunctional biosynthetic peptidoglycan transglycosylase
VFSKQEHTDTTIDSWQRSQFFTRRKVIVAVLISVFLFGWFIPFIPKLKFAPIKVTRWTKKQGEVVVSVGPGTSDWVPLKIISKHLRNAVIVAEDSRFTVHHGLDFQQIMDSIKYNMKKGYYARGASTITQQVVKMAFLSREKSIIRKTREASGAIVMDALYSKNDIIEWYLNLVEFGDNVYGAKDAATHYFKTKPQLLTVAESIHLALVLPSPNRWSQGLRKRALTKFGHARFAWIAMRLRQEGLITKSQWESALTTGDFGRPITGYENLLQDESKTIEDPSLTLDSENDLPVMSKEPEKDIPSFIKDVEPSAEEGEPWNEDQDAFDHTQDTSNSVLPTSTPQ